jgi:hypothetical protein
MLTPPAPLSVPANAKVETCFSTCSEAQVGHEVVSFHERTSRSNSRLQSRQRYS